MRWQMRWKRPLAIQEMSKGHESERCRWVKYYYAVTAVTVVGRKKRCMHCARDVKPRRWVNGVSYLFVWGGILFFGWRTIEASLHLHSMLTWSRQYGGLRSWVSEMNLAMFVDMIMETIANFFRKILGLGGFVNSHGTEVSNFFFMLVLAAVLGTILLVIVVAAIRRKVRTCPICNSVF